MGGVHLPWMSGLGTGHGIHSPFDVVAVDVFVVVATHVVAASAVVAADVVAVGSTLHSGHNDHYDHYWPYAMLQPYRVVIDAYQARWVHRGKEHV